MINSATFLIFLLYFFASYSNGLSADASLRISQSKIFIHARLINTSNKDIRLIRIPKDQKGFNVNRYVSIHFYDINMTEVVSDQNKIYKFSQPSRNDYAILRPDSAFIFKCEANLNSLYYGSEDSVLTKRADYIRLKYYKIIYNDTTRTYKKAIKKFESQIFTVDLK